LQVEPALDRPEPFKAFFARPISGPGTRGVELTDLPGRLAGWLHFLVAGMRT
jgi:hypothetical protein